MFRSAACLVMLVWSLTAARAAWPAELHVSGVLVSTGQRLAIVNGQISRVGERVDGAEILAIDIRGVRMRAGSQELMAYVGSNAFPAPQATAPPLAPARAALQHHAAPDPQDPAARVYGPVARGETLSEIAAALRHGGVTSAQLMTALFRTNPDAFGNNINLLREGAVLEIPPREALLELTVEAATAEVASHARAWAERTENASARVATAKTYGPVRAGETLSEISRRLMPEGVTPDQMMLALFDANTEAFSGNVHRLRAGAVLRVPVLDQLASRSPTSAAAEVARHTVAWRAGPDREAVSASGCTATPQAGRCAPARDPPERVPI